MLIIFNICIAYLFGNSESLTAYVNILSVFESRFCLNSLSALRPGLTNIICQRIKFKKFSLTHLKNDSFWKKLDHIPWDILKNIGFHQQQEL